jgi:class 3 adenylate cyclase
VNWEELFARVRSLLRVKSLQDELKELNQKLEQRVVEQVAQLHRLGRLKRFFSKPVAEAIVAGGEELLEPHRREITAVFLDLRGFTAFTDRADPDQVVELLRAYHATLGRTVGEFSGTLEHFAGDGVMIFFNDPLPVDKPAERSVRMALALQQAFTPIAEAWAKLGHEVGLGIGIAQGTATLGVIGFEERWEYAAIGNVPNLAARLCGAAHAGEIIVDLQVEQDIAPHRRDRGDRPAQPARLPAAGARLPAEIRALGARAGRLVAELERVLEVLRQADDQAQAVFRQPLRQLAKRQLGLLVDLGQLLQQLVFRRHRHGCTLRTARAPGDERGRPGSVLNYQRGGGFAYDDEAAFFLAQVPAVR